MNILITGGTGFIGHLLIANSSEHHFTVVSRNKIKAAQKLKQISNVDKIISLDELSNLDEYDAVINLAGEPIIDKRWSATQKRTIEASRWDTTDHLVTCFNQSSNPPEVFISGSAIGIYGEQGDTEITESYQSTAHDFSAHLCREWEARVQPIADKCRLMILRTGIVLHPEFGALQKMLLPFKMGAGGPIGSGAHYFSWIHWQDMIEAIRFLLHNEKASGLFNMTAPNPLTNKQFATHLGKALKRPAFLPMPPMVLQLMLGEASELLTVSQRVVPNALLDSGFEFQHPDADKALNSMLN